jgi:hypothetical protein
MDDLYQNTHMWELMFKYLDYNDRMSLNRLYPDPVVRKFTRQQAEQHHALTMRDEYCRLLNKEHTEHSLTRSLAQLLNPRYNILLKYWKLREVTIRKCEEVIPILSEKYARVVRRVLEVVLQNENYYTEMKFITV